MKSNRLSWIVLAACLVLLPIEVTCVWASEQLETDDLRSVEKKADELAKKYGTKDVLLVFDVDNTVLAMRQNLGSDQWFGWQAKLLQEKPLPPAAVASDIQGLLQVQSILYSVSGTRPTQKNLPKIIRRVQKKGFRTIVLTSRGVSERAATRRELEANGFRFANGAMPPVRGYPGTYQPYCAATIEQSGLSLEEAEAFLAEAGPSLPVVLKAPRPVSYSEGLYLTAGQHKGAMLRMLLNRSGSSYRAIVFADDHQHNVDRVFAAFKDTGVEIVTYRYSREDANVKDFLDGDKEAVTKQWNRIEEVLKKTLKMPRVPQKQKMPAKRAA